VSKLTAALVVLLTASVVALAAVVGRHNEAVAVPTATRAEALAEAWLAQRFEDVNIERWRATRVESVDEFKSVITAGPQLTLGRNGERLPVWVVTLGATWPGQTSGRALRYVIEAKTGRFLVLSAPLPGGASALAARKGWTSYVPLDP